MIKDNFKNYALILIATIITTTLSTLPMGILGIVITSIISSIIGYTVTKHHYYFVAVVSVCVPLIYSFFTQEFISAITVSLPIVLCGLSLGIAYNTKLSEFKLLGILTGIYTTDILLNIKFLGDNNTFQDMLSSSLEMYSNALSSSYGEQISQVDIDAMTSAIFSSLMKYSPCFIIILCSCLALLMLYVFKKVLKVTKSDISIFKPFNQWHADKSLTIASIFIVVLLFFVRQEGYISAMLQNVFMISVFIFYIFGLSFIDFILRQKMTSPVLRITILVILVLFSFGFSLFILYVLGILDGFWNFRQKLLKSNISKQE